jgi:hypothetical protein
MTREEKVQAIQDMDAVIERAGNLCQSYELAQMEMMATVARAKAIYKRLLEKKAALERELGAISS